jgi:hypothetical protein
MLERLSSTATALQSNPGLAWGLWWHIGLLLLSLAAMPFDRRRILGLNPWIKPIKFDLSVIVFLITIALLLSALPDGLRTTKLWLGWGFGLALIGEETLITLQSARGVRSHMNFDTPLDTAVFAAMGIFILINTLLAGGLLFAWCRTETGLPPAAVWGVRLGLAMLLAGSIEGFRMVLHGSHTVGAPDGGAGLPFVNWSTAHGDLRVAHFFALHALQVLPLVGLALAATRLRAAVQLSGLFAFAAVYGWALWWLFAAAMRGRPLIAP